MRIIGACIDPTDQERLQRALLERNFDAVKDWAVKQAAAGADILDANIGAPGVNEAEPMPQVVHAIRAWSICPFRSVRLNPGRSKPDCVPAMAVPSSIQ